MHTLIGRSVATVLAVLCFTIAPVAYSNGEGQVDHAPAGHAGHGENPLLDEMVKLDAVFRDVVSGVSLGNGARVHDALEAMHGTMEKTHEGVHHGTVVIPKNADRVKEFVALDKQFHQRLEALAHAAHKNDQNAMVKITKELLDGCVQCHRMFRNP